MPQGIAHRHGGLHARARRPGTLAQQEESHDRRQAIHHRRQQHGDGHKARSRLSLLLRPQHISQTQPQRQHAPEIAKTPAQATHAPHGFRLRQFGQEGCRQRLAKAVEDVGDNNQEQGQRHHARLRQRQCRGREHAARGGQHQQALLLRMRIRPGADGRHQQHHHCIGDAQRQCPGQGRPVGLAGNPRHEIGREHRRQHHRGVAGVGKVIHRPAEHLAAAHAGIEGRIRQQVHEWVQREREEAQSLPELCDSA